MSLVKELLEDIQNPQMKLSSILRKAKEFASALGNEEFRKWIDSELNGYNNNEEIPDYRQFHVESRGQFFGPFGTELKNALIPPLSVPDQIRGFAEEFSMFQGVRSLESLLESDFNTFEIPWPANFVTLLSNRIYKDYNCVSAWHPLARNQVEQVLDTVRNRLLEFILELQKIHPEISRSEDEISEIPKEKVQSASSILILGNQNVIAAGSQISQNIHQEMIKNDLDALLRVMRQIGVQEKDIEELKKAIEEDGPRTAPEKLGSKVAKWVGRITEKILDGSYKTISSVTSKLIVEALFRYYGWR